MRPIRNFAPAFVPTLPTEVVKTPNVPGDLPSIAVNTNGNRFLLTRPVALPANESSQPTNGMTHINVVFNWFSELTTKLPTKGK